MQKRLLVALVLFLVGVGLKSRFLLLVHQRIVLGLFKQHVRQALVVLLDQPDLLGHQEEALLVALTSEEALT